MGGSPAGSLSSAEHNVHRHTLQKAAKGSSCPEDCMVSPAEDCKDTSAPLFVP